MTEEQEQRPELVKNAIEQAEASTNEDDTLEEEQTEEQKKLDHIKGLVTLERGSDYYRVVFYDDHKHLIFKELDYDRVDFVGRFYNDSFDPTNLTELEEIAEKALSTSLRKRFL
ncbi:hypothetical protein ASF99_16680 [Exiguobacterium sp. Leaf187]|uniref:Uncharacterized protein n=1 Tax=Exiguobacterium indicum TaxID=296995 RepID=A0A0V8GFM5_9BACL|nr:MULTISPECIES: hypothetical protein [Exiguobacterium]AHA29035.1 hypothetical protein U719_03855 [Exiguobacterium sp. MH3]KQS20593.1 hypothetical protein ASF99_16680 [Exiguobacterium sp. Leaf187]KSU49068.1 hypothetical protein AS033_06735 [Exiguobacterium enclense]KTR28669.1 hypothetical protein RSA11_00935 [Exiguobacterium indicum]MCQ4091155.1 hypothetical protein [Exiguobacterium sp. LL15]